MSKKIRGISAIAAAGLLLAAGAAYAQDSTTGAVRGAVKDKANGETVVGATVVATSPALQGQQAVITDGSGAYYLAGLKPGTYEIAVYYGETQFSRKNVLIRLGKVSKVNITIDSAAVGEKIVIEGRATIVDQDSTKTGTTITQDYTDNIPTGRTFGAVLESASASQGDLYGTSFGGSTSIENTYIVEGVNTTDPGFGLQTTNLPNEFIRETEVITGGYEAEYGRSTGGIINVVTKSGSNEFHGSVFAYWTPGALTGSADEIPQAVSSIDYESDLANAFDVGAEIGGPIIKDKLWFHVGINPSFTSTDVDRVIKSQVDCNPDANGACTDPDGDGNIGDGVPDVDLNGFGVSDVVGRTTESTTRQQYYYTGKLTGALNQDNQGSLSVLGSPSNRDIYLTGGPGEDSSRELTETRNIIDIALKWTSKFNNSASQVDVILGYHYDKTDLGGDTLALGSGMTGAQSEQIRFDTFRPLTDFDMFEQNNGRSVPAECVDGGPSDIYAQITNCPVRFYRLGGLGFLTDDTGTRAVGAVSFTQRVKAAGQHRFKVGIDGEEQGFDSDRGWTGGRRLRDAGAFWRIRQLYTVDTANGDTPCGSDIDGVDGPDASCIRVDSLDVQTTTRNFGAYAQDTWAILPNLTVNLGIRYEQQTLFTAEGVQGEISPTTGEPVPDVAFSLNNMWAPRVGISYDWTQEGRSKLFAHWGRFYESIPMDINVRAYGGEVGNIRFVNVCDTSAGLGNPVCDPEDIAFGVNVFFGGGEELADPDLKAQYLDEIVLGTEYEVLPDFKIGASYVRRELGRVIEDISTDGATTYVVANPGTVNQGGVDDLRAQADAARAGGDMARGDFLDFQADQFEGSGIFDTPERTYNGLILTADKRFSKNFFMTASYTYSKLKGNFPGLFSPETGQLDPNLTSMFDLPDLMANRFGDLPADRPHNIKIDGFYRAIAPGIGAFTIGARIRGASGLPHQTLGAHELYGFSEAYILPRGQEFDFVDANGVDRRYGRSPFTTRFDTHLAYKRQINAKIGLEAFVDIFNLFNQQPEADVDEDYTFDPVNPIVGGDADDLPHLKSLGSGGETVTINPNFGNINARQAPVSARFGIRLTF